MPFRGTSEGARLTEQIRTQGTDSLKQEVTGITMQAAVRMFLKEADGKSLSHASKIRSLCKTLVQKFPGPLAHVSPTAIDRWLKSLRGSETSKAGIRSAQFYKAGSSGKSGWKFKPNSSISHKHLSNIINIQCTT